MEEIEENLPVWVLRPSTVESLAIQLNPKKIFLSDTGLLRDWRGVFELSGLQKNEGQQLYDKIRQSPSPFQEFLSQWKKKETSTIRQLLCYLEEIDRFDVIDDNLEKIKEDIALADAIAREKGMDLVTLKYKISESGDKNLLTFDDLNNLRLGKGLARYDAFVLSGEGDEEFMMELVRTMEKQGLTCCIKDRDLLGGAFEHEAVMKLISERCSRLVPILSPNFFTSESNNFFTLFAQHIGITEETRKIIPIVYQDCRIPANLGIYHKLQVNNKYFLEKLCRSVNENVVYRPPNDEGRAAAPLPLPVPAPCAQKSSVINGSTKQRLKANYVSPKAFVMFPKKKTSKEDFSPVVVDGRPSEQEEGEGGALNSGELLLPDVPTHEPGHGLQQLGQTVRRSVGKLLPKLGPKAPRKYKEKPTTSAC